MAYSDEPSKTSRTTWTAKDIIRNKQSGNLYRVIKVVIDLVTEVYDMQTLCPTPILLYPKDYSDYSLDRDMILKKDKWEFEPNLI